MLIQTSYVFQLNLIKENTTLYEFEHMPFLLRGCHKLDNYYNMFKYTYLGTIQFHYRRNEHN